ncbi:MAG: hypothetical protein DMG72_22140 [Acidobacteria bacterium]|nr:MAG: hypothetical protein DMG72_22140 [Acidobacteriota bacterium]
MAASYEAKLAATRKQTTLAARGLSVTKVHSLMWKWDMICSADAELRKERLRTRTLPNQSSRSVSFEAIRYPSISRLLPLALAAKHSFGSWRSLRTFSL